MDRAQFIDNLVATPFSWNRGSLIAACIACLTPEETCNLLDLTFAQEYAFRRAILRQIGRDMERRIEGCHLRLVQELMSVVEGLPYNKKRSCAYCLRFLYDYLPSPVQREVIGFLLNSKYITIRRKAYKKLESDWNPEYQPLVLDAWDNHQDPECAALIVRAFPLSHLQKQLPALERALAGLGPWHLARLFLRVGEADRSTLERLSQLDDISFAYVSAKLQHPISETRARELFARNRLDERAGLLVWSFGQLGLWSTLTDIADRVEDLERERRAHLTAR